jgi:fibronectin type 3 domain-containing protein
MNKLFLFVLMFSSFGFSQVATPTAIAPVALTGITLAWTSATAKTSFNVYKATTTGTEGSIPYARNVVATSYFDTVGTPGTTYFYTITSVLNGKESAQSVEVSVAFPTPPTPGITTPAVPAAVTIGTQ